MRKKVIGIVGSKVDDYKEYTSTIFKEWYMSLPRERNMHTIAREIIMDACDISVNVFYDWIAGRSAIPVASQHLINQIAGETVFKLPGNPALKNIRSIWQQRNAVAAPSNR